MLSVLIPVYNEPVGPLVRELHRQGRQLGIPFEIVCFDDASDKVFQQKNRVLNELPSVYYRELSQNVGRAAIRNLLADAARYEYLLFLDSDVQPKSADLLKRYVDGLAPKVVLVGGVVYAERPPTDPDLLLHYRYGQQRETQSKAQRQQHPYASFKSANFLITSDLFQTIRFDERLRDYGHEDTLFGFSLQLAGIEVRHLNNPVVHLGLEPATVFLKKQLTAVQNLYRLNQFETRVPSRLWTTFQRLHRSGLHRPVRWVIWPLFSIIKKRLATKNAPLWLLDIFKLSHLLNLEHHGTDSLSS